MSTPAWIVRETSAANGDAYEGVHVEYDGYCDHIGAVIVELVSRLGWVGAQDALFSQDSWSGLDLRQRVTGSARYIEVEGVGEAYLADDTRPHEHRDSADWFVRDAGWAYVFGADGGLAVFCSRRQIAHVSAQDLSAHAMARLFESTQR